MQPIDSRVATRGDAILVGLLGLILFLGLLFWYLTRIELSIAEHARTQERLYDLKLLDKHLDALFHRRFTFINYDRINDQMARFEVLLKTLQQTPVMSDANASNRVASIAEAYALKADQIERFKTANASAINSLHILRDLQTFLADDADSVVAASVNRILLSLMQLSTNRTIDLASLDDAIEHLRIASQTNTRLHTFYLHVRSVVRHLETINRLDRAIRDSPLYARLDSLHRRISEIQEQRRYMHKTIVLVFFALAVVIVIILMWTYRRSLWAKYELQAFKYAVEHGDNAVVMTDPQRRIVYVNEIFEKSTGYTRAEVMGKNPWILKSGRQEPRFYEQMNAILNRGEKWEGEFINKRKDGSLYYERASIVPVYLDDTLINYLAIKLDVSEYVEQAMELERSAAVFDHTEEAIIITDRENRILSVNNAFCRMYGLEVDEVVGKDPRLLKSDRHSTPFFVKMWEQLLAERVWRGKIYNRGADGDVFPVWMTVKAMTDSRDAIVSYIAVQTDMRDIIMIQEKADYLAYHDSLTHLDNRLSFEEYLGQALKKAHRDGSGLAVLFIDLDRFKVINDTLGHHVGDEMLKQVAQRILDVLRESDLVARFGGDEFVVALEGMQDKAQPGVVAGKILEILKPAIRVGAHTLQTSASIGIAHYPEDGDDVQSLIKHADNAMYLAKNLGKNNFQFYEKALSDAGHKRLEMEQRLQKALHAGEFSLRFQPQYALQTRRIVGVEALLRWHNAVLGEVSPDAFIPVAEDIGLIQEIGLFVFEEACKGFVAMRSAGLPVETVAINVSSIQFKQPYLLESFLMLCSQHGAQADQIELEITERYIMEDCEGNLTVLNAFRRHGFRISIDDFGTGYSSMSYLKRLPLDTIKIDKSFIDEIPDDRNDLQITRAIIALAQSLGYMLVAEGIENDAQEQQLKSFGCDLGQGYFFCEPVTVQLLIERFSEPIEGER